MEDMIGNLEGDILSGDYEIFNKVTFPSYPERHYRPQTLAETSHLPGRRRLQTYPNKKSWAFPKNLVT